MILRNLEFMPTTTVSSKNHTEIPYMCFKHCSFWLSHFALHIIANMISIWSHGYPLPKLCELIVFRISVHYNNLICTATINKYLNTN